MVPGYRSTNLEQIAGAARLTKGAVYFYFRSKEAVLIALLERVRRIVVDDAIAIVNAAGSCAALKLSLSQRSALHAGRRKGRLPLAAQMR